jgi:tRNA-dihydrouridine synthase A
VATCVQAMRDAVALPVTVKHRIGLDANEEYGFVRDFVGTVAQAGCDVFIVHARNAVLKGLSPKENREVPRLRYEVVHRLKRDFPNLTVVLNGGLDAWPAVEREIERVDGVMLGRVAYHDPMFLAPVDWRLFGDDRPPPTRDQVLLAMIPYVSEQCARGVPLRSIVRHMLGLYHGRPGGRRFRQMLSDAATLKGAGAGLLEEALVAVEPALEASLIP